MRLEVLSVAKNLAVQDQAMCFRRPILEPAPEKVHLKACPGITRFFVAFAQNDKTAGAMIHVPNRWKPGSASTSSYKIGRYSFSAT